MQEPPVELPQVPNPASSRDWRRWVPKWSIIVASAILAGSVAATMVLALTDLGGGGGDAGAPENGAAEPTATTAAGPPATIAASTTEPPADAPSETSPQDLQLRIALMAAELAEVPVLVRTGEGQATLSVAELGISLEAGPTFAAVRDLRRADAASDAWTALSSDPALTERRYRVDRAAAATALAEASGLGVTATQPSVTVVNGMLAVDLGTPGRLVDADTVVDGVLRAIARGLTQIQIEAHLVETEPLRNTPELQEAVNAAQQIYGRSLEVIYAGRAHLLTIETIASWLVLEVDSGAARIAFDADAVGPYLEAEFAPESAPNGPAAMAIVNGAPKVVAADGSEACCSAEVGMLIAQALGVGVKGPLALPARPAVSAEERAYLESLGIVEVVGSFTTTHSCCLGRVHNIHRFADLMRGALIEPGASLSLNDHVGERTKAKGFVEGGFIHKGVLVEDVGGGVSQFATTIFNALIHAGMDIDEYQTHSLYLSRYPFGLDPTISYPKPDLRFTNPTPYGLLIWPSYTGTSITVDLYSTRNVEVNIGEPAEELRGFCRRVRTERVREFSDGTVDRDSFFAAYRPEEGRNCDGTRSVPRQCVDPQAVGENGESGDGGANGGANGTGGTDGDSSNGTLVEEGSERDDGSLVACPPPECTEREGERESELPRYPDDPCIGVDLSTIDHDEDEEGEDGETGEEGDQGDEGDGQAGDGSDGQNGDSEPDESVEPESS